jgi:hypothetical protein
MTWSGLRPIRSGASPATSRSILAAQKANQSLEQGANPVLTVN